MRCRMSKYAFVLLVVFAFCSVCRAEAEEHLFLVSIWTELEYPNGGYAPVSCNIDIEMYTDDEVGYIEFTTPVGYTFLIPNTTGTWDDVNQVWTERNWDEQEQAWCWELKKEAADMSGLSQFGDGWYAVVLHYTSGGAQMASFYYGDSQTSQPIPQPVQKPIFTSPADFTSISSPLTATWQSCTDPNAKSIYFELELNDDQTYFNQELNKLTTSVGPLQLAAGLWEATLYFDNYEYQVNANGIGYWCGKTACSYINFTVGQPWIVYEVWGGSTDYNIYGNWWEYYHNIQNTDYVKLGESQNSSSLTVSGNYPYYVIVSHQPIPVDAVRGSNNQYYYGGWTTGGTEFWENISGAPDGEYCIIGYRDDGGFYRGFVKISNPGGNEWDGLTVITHTGKTLTADIVDDGQVNMLDLEQMAYYWMAYWPPCKSDPVPGDINGDCYVNLEDFAILCSQWMQNEWE